MKAFLSGKVLSQLEAATGVPKLFGQVGLDVLKTLPTLLQHANNSVHSKSLVAELASKVPSPDSLRDSLRDLANAQVASGSLGGAEAANDIFSALGLKLWIIQAASPNARVRVIVPAEPGSVFSDETVGSNSRLTPRQFVRFMREARIAGMPGDSVEAYVSRMVNEGHFQCIPILPLKLQTQLYTDIARLIVFTFQRSVMQLDNASLWGHSLKVSAAALVSQGGRRPNAVGHEQLQAIVDHMLESQAIKMPFLPRCVERRLYANCMTVVFQLVGNLLTGEGEEVRFMGQRLRFELEAEPVAVVRRMLEEHPVSRCRINEAVLKELVEELLSDEAINTRWMPDLAEKHLYMSVMRMLIRIAEDVVCRLKLNVLGRQINMSILSHVDIVARQEILKGKTAGAHRYYEEEEPLRTVSTNELEELLKDLDEQRRVLVALQELGGANFDLTAEAPMQREDQRESRAPEAPPVEEKNPKVHEFQHLAHTLKLARSLSLNCEINADIKVPHSMIADLETYPLWMPWCTSGRFLSSTDPSQASAPSAPSVFQGEVGFGFETGTFLGTVGDAVRYVVTVEPPHPLPDQPDVLVGRVMADAVDGFTYGKRLVYDWRFTHVGKNKTRVELDMLFQARSVLYMPVWDSMQNMVVNNMLQAFRARAEELQTKSASVHEDHQDHVHVAPPASKWNTTGTVSRY